MASLLYLVHRIPFPPDKGDKVRSYNLLRHLTEHHRVFVGTFVDDPVDEAHVETLRGLCTELFVARLHPRRARLASLGGLLHGRALTLDYYSHRGLQHWVDGLLAREAIETAVIYSSAMAQYAQHRTGLPLLVDFVDVDSAKWTEYAGLHRWPMSWLYRREGEKLLAYERKMAAQARRSFFSTAKEAALFVELAPESSGRVEAMSNGVDANFFAPETGRASPFAPGEKPLVFTGAMDYWPNVDAVCWFAQDVLPKLRLQRPSLRFFIVGRTPSPAVRALARPDSGVIVTGTVADVRPYLQHAAVVVAPLRIARGIQNKILEAMAMECPVVAAHQCVDALEAMAGKDLLPATDAADFVRVVDALLRDPARAERIGRAARAFVLGTYDWAARLATIDPYLPKATAPVEA